MVSPIKIGMLLRRFLPTSTLRTQQLSSEGLNSRPITRHMDRGDLGAEVPPFCLSEVHSASDGQ